MGTSFEARGGLSVGFVVTVLHWLLIFYCTNSASLPGMVPRAGDVLYRDVSPLVNWRVSLTVLPIFSQRNTGEDKSISDCSRLSVQRQCASE